MIYILIGLGLFIILAAQCNGIMDIIWNAQHRKNSIFADKNPNIWNPEISWSTGWQIPIFKYHADAWHILKTSMLWMLFTFPAYTFHSLVSKYLGHNLFVNSIGIDILIWWLITGIVWTLSFNFAYNHEFNKKTS